MKDDSVCLRHVVECMRRIETNTMVGREAFLASVTLQDATLRNLQTMTEACQRLSDSCEARRPDVEWQRIAAFHNVLGHNYLGIDMEQIWDIVTRDLPPLKKAALDLLAHEKP